jgi:beta-glucuronidase
MRATIFLLLAVSLTGPAFAQTDSLLQHVAGRTLQSLDGRWQYIIDPYETGYYDYRRKPYDQSPSGKGGVYDDRQQTDPGQLIEYDFNHSPTLKVPGDWNSQNSQLLFYEGTVWYRNVFHAEPVKDKRYLLYFGAVNYEAHVYLNGRKLGVHVGGFTPFQFDVTGLLKPGDNSVVVKVDNTRHPDDVPTVSTDWWNYGGITRDVDLVELPSTFIRDYAIQLAPGRPGEISGYVQLDGAHLSEEVTIGIPEAGISRKVQTDATGKGTFTIAAPGLRKWSPDSPHLYGVLVSSAEDKVRDSIGFRTIAVRGKDILLNGKPVFLRGISLHDENPLIPGRTQGEGDLRMLLQWVKDLHCNYVRLAHYPHNEAMLRLADQMGIMVWAEIPVYWTISWENQATFANAEKQLTDMITRDKNRASVIIWSIGNETPLSEPRLRFMGSLADRVRSLDSTRLVAAALEVHTQGHEVTVDDPLAEKLDLVSFNEYLGWYSGSIADIGKMHFHIAFDKPVVITEFGGDALGGYHGDSTTRWTEEYQEWLYKNQLAMLGGLDGLRGMTPWILVDFRSPRRFHPVYQDYWNRKGLLSETGKPKKAYYILKAFYEHMQRDPRYVP